MSHMGVGVLQVRKEKMRGAAVRGGVNISKRGEFTSGEKGVGELGKRGEAGAMGVVQPEAQGEKLLQRERACFAFCCRKQQHE